MPKLPRDLSGRQVKRALEKIDFVLTHQVGSHMVMRRDSPRTRAVVPDHKQIKPGTLKEILNQAGLTLDEFLNLL